MEFGLDIDMDMTEGHEPAAPVTPAAAAASAAGPLAAMNYSIGNEEMEANKDDMEAMRAFAAKHGMVLAMAGTSPAPAGAAATPGDGYSAEVWAGRQFPAATAAAGAGGAGAGAAAATPAARGNPNPKRSKKRPRKQYNCGHCGVPGHNNRRCPRSHLSKADARRAGHAQAPAAPRPTPAQAARVGPAQAGGATPAAAAVHAPSAPAATPPAAARAPAAAAPARAAAKRQQRIDAIITKLGPSEFPTGVIFYDQEHTGSRRLEDRIIQQSAVAYLFVPGRAGAAPTVVDVSTFDKDSTELRDFQTSMREHKSLRATGTPWMQFADREGVRVNHRAAKIHGWTTAKLDRRRPPPLSQRRMLLSFIKWIETTFPGADQRLCLVGHNSKAADNQFLFHALRREGLHLPPTMVYAFDTYVQARTVLQKHRTDRGLPKKLGKGVCKLGSLHYQLTGKLLEGAHDALADAQGCVPLMHYLEPVWSKGGGFMDWSKLMHDEACRTDTQRLAAAAIRYNANNRIPGDDSDDDLEVPGPPVEGEDEAKVVDGPVGAADEWEPLVEETPIPENTLPRGVINGYMGRMPLTAALKSFDSLWLGVEGILVTETNLYAKQKRSAVIVRHWLQHRIRRRRGSTLAYQRVKSRPWKDVTKRDLRIFFGIIMHKALLFNSGMSTWWSEDSMYSDGSKFTRLMSQTRWQQILRYLHASDSTKLPTQQERDGGAAVDKMYKLRAVLDVAMAAWRADYNPSKFCAVDESMVGFEGRVSFRTVMIKKAHPCGVKWWVLADSSNSYILRIDAKTDRWKATAAHKFEGTDVVIRLCRDADLTDKVIVTDNYFTSMEEMMLLAAAGHKGIGILRTTRAPEMAHFTPADEGNEERGAFKMVRHNETGIVVTTWRDARVVFFMSSAGTGSVGAVKRWIKTKKQHNVVTAPGMVRVYNFMMGPIDRTDQNIQYFTVQRCLNRVRKWWVHMLMYILDLTLHNARILYNDSRSKVEESFKPMDNRVFRVALLNGLYDELVPAVPAPTAPIVAPGYKHHHPSATECKQKTKKGTGERLFRGPCVVCLHDGWTAKVARTNAWCACGKCGAGGDPTQKYHGVFLHLLLGEGEQPHTTCFHRYHHGREFALARQNRGAIVAAKLASQAAAVSARPTKKRRT